MKAEKIIRLLWRGEVYETRSVLFVAMNQTVQRREFEGSAMHYWLSEHCQSIDYHRDCLELLFKVFHDEPEDLRRKAYAVAALVRWLRNRKQPVKIETMHHRDREPKWMHFTHNHYTHREIEHYTRREVER